MFISTHKMFDSWIMNDLTGLYDPSVPFPSDYLNEDFNFMLLPIERVWGWDEANLRWEPTPEYNQMYAEQTEGP